MNQKISRIEKLVRFERQMMNSMTQDVLSLTNRHRRIGLEMDRLSQCAQSSCMTGARNMDQVASRRTYAVMAETIRDKISQLKADQDKLQGMLIEAQERLGKQRVRVNVLEQLLRDRRNEHQAMIEEEQIRELLDIASRRFQETQR